MASDDKICPHCDTGWLRWKWIIMFVGSYECSNPDSPSRLNSTLRR